MRCKGACINPKEDEAFCGAKLDCLGANAGLSCGANRVCEDGACKSGCKANEVLCDGVCINPKNDFNYCGAKNSCSGSDAGKTCSIGQVCSDGSCKLQCKTGEVLCNNRCVNPLLDNAFCGATGDCSGSNAGANCQAPESCVDGTCGLYCNDWQTKCEGKCVNGQSDPSYCGAPAKSDCVGPNKGVKCANNEICSRGQCVQAGCEEADFSVNLPKSDVMLVLDKSASMSLEQIADGASTKTRWVVLHEVVEQLLTDYKDKVRFGLKLFPAKEVPVADPCLVDPGVDVEISESSNNDILGKMPARTATVTGRTPTATGFIRASTHAISVSARSDNPTAIMLIADGQMSLDSAPPTERCEGQTEDILKTEADKARSQGVSVYSVGIALAGAGRTLLTEVAGGAENYVQADNKAQLRAAMESILAKVPNCKVPINTVPQYHELMKVRTSDGSSSFDAPWQYQYADCSAVAAANLTRGYVYTKRSGPYDEIELCGDSCKDYKKTASVDIKQNCPPPP